MMKRVFTKTKGPNPWSSEGQLGREQVGEEGQGKGRKCFYSEKVLAGSLPQLTQLRKSDSTTSAPATVPPSCL